MKYKSQSFGLHQSKHPMKLVLSWFALLVMMQAGDLHPNPGPYKPKFPCALCDKAAKWNQRAVSCDECHGWFLVDCMNMSTAVYNVLAESSQIEWICCQCGVPNFSSSLFSNSIELSNSFDCLSNISDSNASGINITTSSSSGLELPSSPLASSSPTKNSKQKPKSFKPRQQLKVMVVNFQGLRSKISDLACCIEQHSPDIIIGTETYLTDNVLNNELIPNYTIIRKDRDFSPSKGGILLAFRDDLVVTHPPDLNADWEIVWATIEIQGAKQITVGAFYRSQIYGASSDYFEQLHFSLQKIKKEQRRTGVVGGGL